MQETDELGLRGRGASEGADGGKAVNTVPDYAKGVFRFRATSAETVAKNIAWVKDIAKGAGLATQTKEKVTTITGIYDSMPNTVMAERVTEHLNRYFPTSSTSGSRGTSPDGHNFVVIPKDGEIFTDTIRGRACGFDGTIRQ